MPTSTVLKRAAAVLCGALAAAVSLPSPAAVESTAARAPRFVTLELPSTPPAPVGTVCPGSSSCWNQALEPQIRADGEGSFYAATENGLSAGTIAAKSTDGGLHYASLASPNHLSQADGQAGLAPGGGDVDVATAPVKNTAGFYNVYVASLSLAEVDVSTSTDGGATWRLNPTGARIPGDDREWIAADGATKVCISYHDLATFNVNVDCSYDGGVTFSQHAASGAIDAAHAFLLQNNQIGNLAIDPASHVVYQPIVGIASADEVVCGFVGTCRYHAVWMAVSADGGRTFTDYPVYIGPSDQVGYAHIFPNVTVDRAGVVYALFSDDHNLLYTFSTDHGRSWSRPVAVNRAPANTAIFPWAVAGDAGKLDVVYYGTSYYDGKNSPDNYPKTADWHVYFAQNLHATKPGSAFTQVQVTPVIHYGGVCEMGVSCAGNRDLFDDFGVAASPATGLASIVYTDDQYRNDPAQPPSPTCTPERSNTVRCDHTSIATQISGGVIFG